MHGLARNPARQTFLKAGINRMASINKTALYDDWPNLPPLVRRAAAMARENDFLFSCIPEHGE